jgi:hypothetical protein
MERAGPPAKVIHSVQLATAVHGALQAAMDTRKSKSGLIAD